MIMTIPRIVLAGTNSGCGKTTVSCAVMQALVNRGLKVGAFKCGPDYIDPMFHSRIIGAKSSNLDLSFFSENTARYLLAKNGADRNVSMIEGVMGFYDGMGLTSVNASTYDVSRVTESPVVLVVGAKGASLSILAVIKGFLELYPDNRIAGVILNGCTAMTYGALAGEITKRFPGVQPLGFLPILPECSLESRHLGLITADEITDLRRKLQLLAEQAEKTIDLNALLSLADSAGAVSFEPVTFPCKEPVRIGVARDKAFCFYYEDSLNLLRELGAELVPFSPLSDSVLPEDLQGLYLGGGYPELYADALSKNESMRRSVRQALEQGLPCIAECGGFMYLNGSIAGTPMAGLLPGNAFDTGKLTRFGYIQLTAKKENLLCPAGGTIRAHEFHHWDVDFPGDAFIAEKSTGRQWACVHASETLYAGFPHFHFYANPDFALRFYDACIKEKHRYD